MARPKGSKNKHGYKMSDKAWNQRVLAPLKSGEHSKIFKEIIAKELDGKYGDEIAQLKLEFWKRTSSSPALALLDLASELYSFIQVERLQHPDKPISKNVVSATKSLVDIMKELSRISLVSADKKMEFLQGRDLDDLSFSVIPEEEVKKAEDAEFKEVSDGNDSGDAEVTSDKEGGESGE